MDRLDYAVYVLRYVLLIVTLALACVSVARMLINAKNADAFAYLVSLIFLLIPFSVVVAISNFFDWRTIRLWWTQPRSFRLLVFSTIAVIVVIAEVSLFLAGDYIAMAISRPDVTVESATIRIEPVGSAYNVTAVVVIHNNEAYPVNVTGVFADLGDVCVYSTLIPIPIPYSVRCQTPLSAPVVTVEPNRTATIVASTLYAKAIPVANNSIPITVTVVRADVPRTITPLLAVRPYPYRVPAIARLDSGSESR